MNDLVSRYGKWALVAGAAEGIGAAFSTRLAGAGMNLILADINLHALDLLAVDLEKKYGIRTERIILDLSEENAVTKLVNKTREFDSRLMVYIPAFSKVGKFAEYSNTEIDHFLSLNLATPVRLVHSFLGNKKAGERYGIILMSSLAGMVGPALVAPYAATKAFAILLSESLFYELKDEMTDVLACCAGPTSTPTYWNSNPGRQSRLIGVMDPLDVAGYALKMLGKKPVCIAGWKNRLFYFILTRLLPRKVAGTLVSNSMKKIYQDR